MELLIKWNSLAEEEFLFTERAKRHFSGFSPFSPAGVHLCADNFFSSRGQCKDKQASQSQFTVCLLRSVKPCFYI